MKRQTLALCIALLALGANAPALASPHSHGSPEVRPAAASPSLDQGRKWATDEALRRHMGAIRDLLTQQGDAVLSRSLTWEQARILGAHVESKVAAILADCRLPPEADANLHLILPDLVRGAEILQGRTRQRPELGAGLVARAAQMYATYFDHPDWRPFQ